MNSSQIKIVDDLLQAYQSMPRSINPSWVINQLQMIKEIERKQISVPWTVDDIIFVAELALVDSVQLTEDQAIQILRKIEEEHDSEIGINWDVILDAVEHYSEDLNGH